MSHILQLMLWGRYAAEGGAEHHGDQHYSITINIDTHVADEKYQGEIGKFGKAMEVAELGEMDNSGMVQTLQRGAYIKIVNNCKVTADDSESENCIS